jgi:hypothetical protein
LYNNAPASPSTFHLAILSLVRRCTCTRANAWFQRHIALALYGDIQPCQRHSCHEVLVLKRMRYLAVPCRVWASWH